MKTTAFSLLIFGIAGTVIPSITPSRSAPPQLTQQEKQELRETAKVVLAPLPDKMPGSEDDTPARIALGKNLYFETKLSKNGSISCNSCHRVDAGLGGVDNASVSSGAFSETGDRNAPTVLNAGFHLSVLGWPRGQFG